MMKLLPIFLYLHLTNFAPSVDWNAKELLWPREVKRVSFQVYVPSERLQLKIQKVLIVWVPKLEEYPERPGRQAVRFTFTTSSGSVIECFQVPAIKTSCQTNIGQVLGQGYLSFSPKVGTTIVYARQGDTCIALASLDHDSAKLRKIANALQLYSGNPSTKTAQP